MKAILRYRWAIFAFWLVATVLLVVFQPDINKILQDRGQSPLAAGSPSVAADAILEKMQASTGTDNLIVFYDQNKLSQDAMGRIGKAVDAITANAAELGIDTIVDPFYNADAKSALISEDGTTLMVSFKLNKDGRAVDAIQSAFAEKLQPAGVEYYLTGEDFINNDYLKASVAGVEKSAVLTVIFILIILVLMFRSVVTPLVSLVTVAFTYLASMGIVSQLIDKAGFPVTTLTQVLMVLILFGIGTDYNILLFNRFKEELSQGFSVDESIQRTYRTAGKTIAFSVLTVLIAFFSLIFSESPIYKSGVAVVIGATVLLLQILTLTPFAMKLLGSKIFWPAKNTSGHKQSRLWGTLAAVSTRRSVFAALIVVVLVAVSIVFYQQKLNFDQIGELGDAYSSSKGFQIVADHFGKGQAMPSTLVIQSSGKLDNNQALSVIDRVTQSIQSVKGVKKVSSVTQPQGEPIADFYISSQMSSVTDGMGSMQDGLDQIHDGFTQAEDQLGSADFSKVGDMADGTGELHDAIKTLSDGLSKLQAGLSGSSSQTVRGGIHSVQTNLTKMGDGIQQLADGYSTMQAGYATMGGNYQQIATALLGIKATLPQLQAMVAALGHDHADLAGDANYLQLAGTLDALNSSLGAITAEGIHELDTNYQALGGGFAQANDNLKQMSGGLAQMAAGLKKLESGVGTAADGIGTIVTNMDKVAQGLDQMKTGQQQLADGLKEFGSFGTQLGQVNGALEDISDGLGKSKEFLTQFNADKTFHIPDEAMTSADFQPALDAYLSKDRMITRMIIVLQDDPYSKAAIQTIQQIRTAAENGLKGTALSSATFAIAGPSSTTNDMNDILNRDLNRMILIVLAGVFLVLLLVIRSFWTPIFITLSLVGSYFAAMLLCNTIFINLLHYPGLSSFVPFFAFIIIVALGVDYSIFLMMRFREFGHIPAKEAIIRACQQIGGVVLSAMVILGGTFATLMPSGMVLLIELAAMVIAGLLILCFVMLPVFLPAMIALEERLRTKSRAVGQTGMTEPLS